jgi:hypothetical protein
MDALLTASSIGGAGPVGSHRHWPRKGLERMGPSHPARSTEPSQKASVAHFLFCTAMIITLVLLQESTTI